MLARVADNLYWTARAIERADTDARLLEVSHAMTRESGDAADGDRTVWEPVVAITGDMERFLARYDRVDERSVVQDLAYAEDNPNSIVSCLRRARENAQMVRDHLPTDVWEALNAVYLELSSWPPSRLSGGGLYLFSRNVHRAVALLGGLIDQGMRHDAAWHFLRLGRYCERAEKTARLLEIKYHLVAPADDERRRLVERRQWMALLRSLGAAHAYLRLDGVDPGSVDAVIRLLVTDSAFPRSVVYCLGKMSNSMSRLVADGDIDDATGPLHLIHELRSSLRADLEHPGRDVAREMDRIQAQCNAIHEAIAAVCFGDRSDEGGPQRAQAVRQAQN